MSARIRRLAAVASSALLATVVVAGCGDDSDNASGDGGSDGDDYCSLIEDVRGEFSSLEGADATLGDMKELGDRMSDIADAAPSGASESWGNMQSAVGDMVTALEDAGVDEDKPLQEAVEAVVKEDQSKAKDMMDSMSGLQSVQSDVEKVQKNVKDECDIDLGNEEDEEDSP